MVPQGQGGTKSPVPQRRSEGWEPRALFPWALPSAVAPSQGSRTRPSASNGMPMPESGAKPWGRLCSSCAPASSRWPRAGWSLQQGQAVSEVSVGADGGVCMRYLWAGERGCGWPGVELPGSVLPSVLSELALL